MPNGATTPRTRSLQPVKRQLTLWHWQRCLHCCFVYMLTANGISAPPDTLEDINNRSLQSLQQMRASTGMHPKSSRLPALVPSFSAKIRLRAPSNCYPVSKSSNALLQTSCGMKRANKFYHKEQSFFALLPSQLQGGDEEAWDFAATSEMDDNQGEFKHKPGVYLGVPNSMLSRQ